jgi:energy-converting hydrogenase B subunit D
VATGNLFWAIDYACLAAVLAAAVAVVRIDNLNGAVMALSAVGTVLGLLFVVLGAPDDAHAEVVVGTIALPTLYLVAIGKIRAAVGDPDEADDLGEEQSGVGGTA